MGVSIISHWMLPVNNMRFWNLKLEHVMAVAGDIIKKNYCRKDKRRETIARNAWEPHEFPVEATFVKYINDE